MTMKAAQEGRVSALAEALCATSRLACWDERAEAVLEKLYAGRWVLIRLAGSDND